MFCQTAFLCLRFASCVITQQNATFWGCTPLHWAMTPKFELGRCFCAMHLCRSFIILCLVVWKLSCWQRHPQTHTQTNRQILLKTSSVIRYATTFGKYLYRSTKATNNSSSDITLLCGSPVGISCSVLISIMLLPHFARGVKLLNLSVATTQWFRYISLMQIF